jgi:hypothetical protein
MVRTLWLLVGTVAVVVGCKNKDAKSADAGAASSGQAATTMTPPTTSPSGGGAVASVDPPAVPPGSPPPDGKYERVLVEGVTVPMVNVMNGGAVVLVDTDGTKPRSWEEQYKRKRPDLPPGVFDLHKTNVNKNDSFEDDPIDKEGRWVIDAKGNIIKQ